MKQKNIITIIILIIIFFIILFLLVGKFGIIEVKKPTGYVDIFDINFVFNCNCNCGGDASKCVCSFNCSCKGPVLGATDIWDDEEINKGFIVEDKKVAYEKNTPINIFSHRSYYTVNDVIAPGCENSYQFIVRNNNEFGMIYDFEMNETNEFNINMKYRLKINGKYVLGDNNTWVTANDLLQSDVVLAGNSYNVYTLDWKWFESDNDTEIGTNIEANYKLDINFYANRY